MVPGGRQQQQSQAAYTAQLAAALQVFGAPQRIAAVDHALLQPQDRTTLAMLGAVYQELVEFARARGVLRPGADAAVDAVSCEHGLAPLPGQPACPTH